MNVRRYSINTYAEKTSFSDVDNMLQMTVATKDRIDHFEQQAWTP